MTDAEIAAAYKAGKSTYQIAEAINWNSQAVCRHLRKLGVQLRSPVAAQPPLHAVKGDDDAHIAAILRARPAGFLGHWSTKPGGYLFGRGVAA